MAYRVGRGVKVDCHYLSQVKIVLLQHLLFTSKKWCKKHQPISTLDLGVKNLYYSQYPILEYFELIIIQTHYHLYLVLVYYWIGPNVLLKSLPVKGKVSLVWPLDQLGKPITSITDYYWHYLLTLLFNHRNNKRLNKYTWLCLVVMI